MNDTTSYSIDMLIKAAFEFEIVNFLNQPDDNKKIIKEYLEERVRQIKERHK